MSKCVFKGYVNGKEFTDFDDFKKASEDAIKSGSYSISSRYLDTKEDDDNEEDAEPAPVYVQDFLNTKDDVNKQRNAFMCWLRNDFKKENKDDVKKEVRSRIEECRKNVSELLDEEEASRNNYTEKYNDLEYNIKELREQQEKLKDKIDETVNEEHRLYDLKRYFNSVEMSLDVDRLPARENEVNPPVSDVFDRLFGFWF
jgi:DNA repair exonuclease SbcCD ATPase subunit